MNVNLSTEMIQVLNAILSWTNEKTLKAIRRDDGHGYEVSGVDAKEFFNELCSLDTQGKTKSPL